MQIKDFTDEAIAEKVKRIKSQKELSPNKHKTIINQNTTVTFYEPVKKQQIANTIRQNKTNTKYSFEYKPIKKNNIQVIFFIFIITFFIFYVVGYFLITKYNLANFIRNI